MRFDKSQGWGGDRMSALADTEQALMAKPRDSPESCCGAKSTADTSASSLPPPQNPVCECCEENES